VGRRRRFHDAVDDEPRDDDPGRDATAREAQLSQHGRSEVVELERRRLRARRVDEPLTTVGRGAADPRPPAALTYSEHEMTQAPALTTQMLVWLAEQPRSYVETLDAWKTSCPRLSIWEDALADRLIRIQAGHVHVTPAGRAFLG
jgi:hypothetical protein